MPKKWLYFPFDDVSQDPTMPGNRQRYETKYGQNLTVVGKGQPLNLVGDNDMFIIAGHGLPNKSDIGVTTEKGTTLDLGKFGGMFKQVTMTFSHGKQERMTADDLADQLATGTGPLPLTHKYIKLITCGGAGMVTVDEAKATFDSTNTATAIPVTAHSHETDCLASVLAKALGLRHYNQILVKGYPGFVNAMGAQKKVTVEASAGAQFKEWYQKLFGTDGVALGADYWKDGTVGMVSIPSKLVNDYWFDSSGTLQKQKISLKGT